MLFNLPVRVHPRIFVIRESRESEILHSRIVGPSLGSREKNMHPRDPRITVFSDEAKNTAASKKSFTSQKRLSKTRQPLFVTVPFLVFMTEYRHGLERHHTVNGHKRSAFGAFLWS